MDAVAILDSLGFTNASVVGEKGNTITLRIRTSKGWTYERFTNGDGLETQIRDWSNDHAPE